MEIAEIFSVLGIESTKDAGMIRQAYREKLRVTNPEEDQEGFKRLRAAYEEACAYASREDTGTAAEAVKRDETPSGLWVERAGVIYGNLETRRDLRLWRELLEDDLLLSLEDEENCRVKLLIFLMDHFRLPTDVWKLLDQKLSLVKDAKRLKEHFRADFINYVVSKCVHGEDILFEQFEGAPDGPYDLFLRGYDECWRALQEKKYDQAQETMALADSLGIRHPAMEILRAYLMLVREKKEDAQDIVKGLLEKYPGDVIVTYNSAEILWRADDREASAAVYESLKAEDKRHYMANLRLAEWYYSRGEYRRAKKCVEDAHHEGDDEALRDILVKINAELEDEVEEAWNARHDWESGYELAKCWLQDGKVCRALQLARELEGLAEAREAYSGLMAMLYADEAEYEDAIYLAGVWEKSLEAKLLEEDEEEAREADREKLRQARLIRIQCFHHLGYLDRLYFDRAIREISSMETGTVRDVSLLLEKAQIYLAMGEYGYCLDVTDKLTEEYQIRAAFATAMEAWRRQWDAGGVIRCAMQCIDAYPDYARAYECAAHVYLLLDHRKELQELLEKAKENRVESVVLDAYRYQTDHEVPNMETLQEKLKEFRKQYTERLDDGEIEYYEKGLPILTEYLYWFPDAYLLRERGLFHRSGQHYDEALADFEKALEAEPVSTYTFRGMALTYLYMGKDEQALIYMKRAILYAEEKWPVIYAELALIYSRLGDHKSALEAYRQYENAMQDKRCAGYLLRREVRTMARCGQVAEACEKLDAFYRAEGDPLARYQYLADLCQVTGQQARAAELLREWRTKLLGFRAAGLWRIGAAGLRKGTSAQAGKKGIEPCYNSAEYCCGMGWQELMYGSAKRAIRWLEKMRGKKRWDRKANGEKLRDSDRKEGLCDLIFACILAGEGEKGKKYGKALRAWREKDKLKKTDSYYEAKKARLWLDFLADYYFEEESALQALLDREAETETCRFCTDCGCREIEAGRTLLMLRQGRREEALKRLTLDLERQPLDEFALAIQHTIKERRKG